MEHYYILYLKSPSYTGLTRYVLRDALLPTTVVMCGYLCYCHLPVGFDQSGPSPLTSLINKAFLPKKTAAHWMFFFFFFLHHSAVSKILKPPCLAQIIISQSKSLRSHFFPILTFELKNS